MLTYEEQRELNADIFENTINEHTLNVYLTRGNDEEIKFNRAYIIGAFRQRLMLFDNSKEYTEIAKFFVNTFLMNNSVCYKDNLRKKTHKWSIVGYRNGKQSLYDEISGAFLTYVQRPEFAHQHIDVCPETNLHIYNGTGITLEYCESTSWNYHKIPNTVFVRNIFKLDHPGKTNDDTLKLYEQLNTIICNDNVDKLIDLVNKNESIGTQSYYINKSWFGLSLFEYSILVKAMKCFKYLLLNKTKDRYYYINSMLMRSNNVEAYRVIMNTKSELIDARELAIFAIQYHRNEFFEHLYHNHDLKKHIPDFVSEAIIGYNYDILGFLFENNALDNPTTPTYYLYGDFEKHIVAILYLLEEYNISVSNNWVKLVESLIASPLPVDRVMDFMRKVYIDVGFSHGTHKRYLSKCFQMRKPKEYIDKMVEFIYGHKQMTYSDVWNINPYKFLNALCMYNYDVNIITFIEIMFPPDYVYKNKELTKISTLIHTYPDYNKKLILLLQFYANQLRKHTM